MKRSQTLDEGQCWAAPQGCAGFDIPLERCTEPAKLSRASQAAPGENQAGGRQQAGIWQRRAPLRWGKAAALQGKGERQRLPWQCQALSQAEPQLPCPPGAAASTSNAVPQLSGAPSVGSPPQARACPAGQRPPAPASLHRSLAWDSRQRCESRLRSQDGRLAGKPCRCSGEPRRGGGEPAWHQRQQRARHAAGAAANAVRAG